MCLLFRHFYLFWKRRVFNVMFATEEKFCYFLSINLNLDVWWLNFDNFFFSRSLMGRNQSSRSRRYCRRLPQLSRQRHHFRSSRLNCQFRQRLEIRRNLCKRSQELRSGFPFQIHCWSRPPTPKESGRGKNFNHLSSYVTDDINIALFTCLESKSMTICTQLFASERLKFKHWFWWKLVEECRSDAGADS